MRDCGSRITLKEAERSCEQIGRLRSGDKTLLGPIVFFPVPLAVEALAGNWDWLWLDGQHGLFDPQAMRACIAASNAMGTPCIARVAALDDGEILHVLDAGADGVMVPMVETVEHARAAVAAAKFPPVGRRSYGSGRLIVHDGADYAKRANEETLLVLQIETDAGLQNIEAIAAVPGVDALLIGFADLAISLGQPSGEAPDEAIIKRVLQKASAAVKKEGKILGAFLTSPSHAQLAAEYECVLLAVTTDLAMLSKQSGKTENEFRQSLENGQ